MPASYMVRSKLNLEGCDTLRDAFTNDIKCQVLTFVKVYYKSQQQRYNSLPLILFRVFLTSEKLQSFGAVGVSLQSVNQSKISFQSRVTHTHTLYFVVFQNLTTILLACY